MSRISHNRGSVLQKELQLLIQINVFGQLFRVTKKQQQKSRLNLIARTENRTRDLVNRSLVRYLLTTNTNEHID